ncbi:hypothetical protein A2943_01995 [Candidatus Adlerbacteria bacterium RIFCSPLOWO2_01_FULL_51_16]|uniref:Response regulatory domain-containing protein n=1 Tax=Candidatus Adlerbacteria bacterium RIFCSPLOWO2_01_FULL_51_16 TaxID=1797243 RepID=A0A1F4XH74_9BACT|nr:MAG: hypothetical protein A2943_01995 [Candidatus Adlerbacteria bacterium RIFCSPLOWO2_01_FULL_51_16]
METKKIKVLLVEDDEVLMRLFERQFNMEEIPFLPAESGEKALALLAGGERPDVILLDISLPDIDGFEVLRSIKANPETRHIPVVILSNFSRPSDIEWGKKLGAVRFVEKVSVTPSEITDLVREVLAENKK